MRLAAFAGKFALFIAGMALLTFISLFVVGAYLASWPIMRVSPRARRLTSVMGLATAAMTVARAYGLDAAMTGKVPGNATEDTEDTDTPDRPYCMDTNDMQEGETYTYDEVMSMVTNKLAAQADILHNRIDTEGGEH